MQTQIPRFARDDRPRRTVDMIASAHITAGVAVGLTATRLTTNTWWRVLVALALGVLTHVLMDAIPHGDYQPLPRSTFRWFALAETAVICTVVALILRDRRRRDWWPAILAGLGGATLPDGKFAAQLVFPERIAGTVQRYGDAFHGPFHAGPPASLAVAWSVEIALTLLLLLLLAKFPGRATR